MHEEEEPRYDLAIDIYSPDGRMYQVEYAREAVKKGMIAVGLIYKDGILFIAERRISSKLIENDFVDKIFKIDESIGCASSGLVADARILVNYARTIAQRYRMRYGERIRVRDLAIELSDLKQVYTQYAGVRPFGTSLIVGGMDDEGKHLYETDPSGAFKKYKGGGIGAGKELAQPFLEGLYIEGMNLKEAISFGLGGIYKATEGQIDFMSLELATITKKDGYKELSFEDFKKFVDEILEELKGMNKGKKKGKNKGKRKG
jgi:proteasome alpha subunit